MEQNDLYRFLLLYFLEDLWNPPIYDEIMESDDQEAVIRKYIETWIPWDEKLKNTDWRDK